MVSPNIHAEVIEVQAAFQRWEEFKGRLRERYGFDDSLRLSKQEFMEGREPGEREEYISAPLGVRKAMDWTVLDTSRVLLFIKSVHALDREKVVFLLETDEGLKNDWVVVKGVCSCFNKWCEWSDERRGPVGSRPYNREKA